MPTYVFQTKSGKSLKVTGDAPPSESDLDALFKQAGEEPASAAPAPAPSEPAGKTTDDPVTLGELMADPKAAMYRMGAILKKDVSDPKLWLTVAAGYFAPKLFNAAAPTIAKAAAMTRTVGQVGMDLAPDAVGVISPRLGNALAVAQRARAAMKGAAAAPEPVQAPQPAPAPHMDLSTPVRPSQLTPEQLNQRMTQGTGTPPAPAGPKPPISTPVPTATAEAPPSQVAEGTPKAESIEVSTKSGPKARVFKREMARYQSLQTDDGLSKEQALRQIQIERGKPTPAPVAQTPAGTASVGSTPQPASSPAAAEPTVAQLQEIMTTLLKGGYSPNEAMEGAQQLLKGVDMELVIRRLDAMKALRAGSASVRQMPSDLEVWKPGTFSRKDGRTASGTIPK